MDRPYVLLSCAVSIDGYLDDASSGRLVLSGPADLDRVDALRAACDAIMVGAGTIRADDPSLVVRSADRRAGRTALGQPASPLRVTVTGRGDLDPAARFLAAGPSGALIYTDSTVAARLRALIGGTAPVIEAGAPISFPRILADLAGRGVARLMVEGGGAVLTQFLTLGLADELRLAIAPLFVGDPAAPRLVTAGDFPQNAGNRAMLAGVGRAGDMAVLRYGLSARFEPDWLAEPGA
ncbi:MAG: RibD family protein [Streptosporangiaceae bacterium]